MIWLLIIIVVFVVFFILLVRYKLKNKVDTITCFSGGLGSGKTFESVRLAIKLFKKNSFRTLIKNLWLKFRKKELLEMPKLYSNIPIYINKKYGYSYRITDKILLLQERMPLRSVVLIDEIGAFATQFDYKLPNIIDNFNEFIRFFRHYTQGGYIVVNDQCTENINVWVRRRMNIVKNLSKFYIIPLVRIAVYFEREISISEEIKQVVTDEDNMNDSAVLRLKFLPLYLNSKHYDTYCYSERYKRLDLSNDIKFRQFKTNKLLTCPKDKFDKKTEREEHA